MTNEFLFDAMSEIDFDLIERAEAPVPLRKKPIFRTAMIAASLALFLSLGTVSAGVAGTVAVTVRYVDYVEQNYPEYDGTLLHFAQILLTEDENALSSLLDDDTKHALGGLIEALRENWGGGADETDEGTVTSYEEQTREPEEETAGGGYETNETTQAETEPEITDQPPPGGWTEGLKYTKRQQDGKTVYVVSGIGSCKDWELYIPPTYNGYRVVGIADGAFEGNQEIISVIMPSTVTNVGNRAFKDTYLDFVTLSENLVSIGDYAFQSSLLTRITFPQTLTEIGEGAFRYTMLEHVELPDSVMNVGSGAFSYCNRLESAVLSKGMRAISSSMFSNDYELQSIVIPEGITTIERNAFTECDRLQQIVLPDSVTEIGYSAFSACGTRGGLTISLPDNLLAVDSSAFTQSGLKNIVVPKSLISISEFMFFECFDLESVTVYASMKSIEREAFSYCDDLREIRFVGTPKDWESIQMPDEIREQLTPLVVYVEE